ncbi:MAG: hypothetical protein QOE90_194 [Thermoplasmata archaeon]|jgi:hypothetical protein|nr:hypothetical protein [Thermoplasmata archaeon]
MAATNEAVEDALRLVLTALALVVLVIALMAYRRQRTQRVLLLTIAFGFYALKGLLLSIDFLVGEVPLIDYVGEAGDAVFLLLILAAFLKA